MMRRNNSLIVAVLSGAFGLCGCLTPAEGRKADKAMGITPPDRPIAVADAPDAHLSGTKFNDSVTVGDVRVQTRRVWYLDSLAMIYHERVSDLYFGLDRQGEWYVLVGPEAYENYYSPKRAREVFGPAPYRLERALDDAGY